MSYDINFWRQSRPNIALPLDVYRALNRREPVDGLALLPVDDIHRRLATCLSGYDPADPHKTYVLGQSGVEVIWSAYHFRFDIRGRLGSSHQQIVDVMLSFDCPMYDPQVDRRYDTDNGVAVGATPQFREPTAEEEAESSRKLAHWLTESKARSAAARTAAVEVAKGVLAGTTSIRDGRGQLMEVIQRLGVQVMEPFATLMKDVSSEGPKADGPVLDVCHDLIRRYGKGG